MLTKVLVVHQFSPPGSPQDRQRGHMYGPLFVSAGLQVEYKWRHPIEALGWAAPRGYIGAQLQRCLGQGLWYRARDRLMTTVNDARIAAAARESDVVILIKVDSLSLVRKLREATRARLVYDLADVRPIRVSPNASDIDKILTIVDAVTVDNQLGLAYALRRNGAAYLWPPAAYVEQFDARRTTSRRGRDTEVRLGWIGTPSTASNLYLILESLEDVFRSNRDLHLRLLGVPADHELLSRFEKTRVSYRMAYDTTEMIGEVLDFDIGLFPIFDLDAAAMHGVTKAVIYMAGGAAVVCSPVGDCRSLVDDGVNGLLAAGRVSWTQQLESLIRDPLLRGRIAESGRRTVQTDYSLETCFRHLRAAMGV